MADKFREGRSRRKKVTRLAGNDTLAGVKSIRLAIALAIYGFMVGPPASAAEPAAPEHTGLAVGQKAPSFTLKDQTGRDVSLDALLKKGPVALVFFRSADW